MYSNPMFAQALRFLSSAALALALAFGLLLSHCYWVGGRLPATVLHDFLCMSCQALLPLGAFAAWGLLTGRRPASRCWRANRLEGRLDSRLGAARD